MSEIAKDNSVVGTSNGLQEETLASTDTTSFGKELRASSILKGLLKEHKAQSLIVESLKEELDHLEQNPFRYFQNRKKFLYHAYTRTLGECLFQMKFDVKVCPQSGCAELQLDARYAVSDKEVGLVFGHVYQVNPHEILNGKLLLLNITNPCRNSPI